MKTRKGFTLIELLIVIAVLGALTAMMQLSSKGATAAAKAASVANGLRIIKTASNVYVAEHYGHLSTMTYTSFDNASTDYLDSSVMSSKFSIASKDGHWVAKYTYDGTDTSEFKTKLTEYDNIESKDASFAEMVIYQP